MSFPAKSFRLAYLVGKGDSHLILMDYIFRRQIHQKYDTWYIYRTFTNQIYNLKAVLKYSFSGFSREIFDRNVL